MQLVAIVPDLSAVESAQVQDWVQTLAQRPRHLVGSITTVVESIALVVRVGAAVALLAVVAPVLVPLPLLIFLPVVAAMRVEREMSCMLDDIATDMRLAHLLFQASTEPRSVAEVRLFSMTAALANRQEELLRKADVRQRSSRIRTLRIMTVGWSLFAAGVLGLLWAARGVPDIWSGGILFLLLVLAVQLVGQAEQAALTMRKISRLSTTIERFGRLHTFVDEAKARYRSTRPVPTGLHDGIRIRELSFRHTPQGTDVLHTINLTLPAGTVVALAGPCGAGKSTLVKLLIGLYQPTAGEILIDGRPLTDYDLASWQSRTAAGFQDFCRFELPAGDSIGVGDLERWHDREAANAALGRAGMEDLLLRLRGGLDTPLGRSLPDGVLPSEGSWQKVALARAMMRPAPMLRVLDEPTASLDAESEARLFATYVARARTHAQHNGCITVLVSHRFATVRTADLIIALRDGEVEEMGTHDELIAAGGWYAKVCALQAAGYK
jgi:ATP-binding cassette, subfamily B, bacterial